MPQDTRLRLESVPFPVALLEDPSHASQLRSSLWLLLVLRAVAATRTGTVLATPDELARVAGVKRETLLSQLGHLRTGGYLALQHQNGHLRVKLTHWHVPPPEPSAEAEPEPDPVALRVATVLSDQELIELYYNFYNPDSVERDNLPVAAPEKTDA